MNMNCKECESCKCETDTVSIIQNYECEEKLLCSNCRDLIEWFDNGND